MTSSKLRPCGRPPTGRPRRRRARVASSRLQTAARASQSRSQATAAPGRSVAAGADRGRRASRARGGRIRWTGRAVVLSDVARPSRAQQRANAAPARGSAPAATAASVVGGSRVASRRWRLASKIACVSTCARTTRKPWRSCTRAARAPAEAEGEPLERGGRERGGGAVGGRLARILRAKVGVKGRAVGPERVAERVRRRVDEFGEATRRARASRTVRLHRHGVGGRRVAQQRFERTKPRRLCPRQRVDALFEARAHSSDGAPRAARPAIYQRACRPDASALAERLQRLVAVEEGTCELRCGWSQIGRQPPRAPAEWAIRAEATATDCAWWWSAAARGGGVELSTRIRMVRGARIGVAAGAAAGANSARSDARSRGNLRLAFPGSRLRGGATCSLCSCRSPTSTRLGDAHAARHRRRPAVHRLRADQHAGLALAQPPAATHDVQERPSRCPRAKMPSSGDEDGALDRLFDELLLTTRSCDDCASRAGRSLRARPDRPARRPTPLRAARP